VFPKHNVLIMDGDMNAHINRDMQHHTFSFHETTNRDGEHLHMFLLENKLHCMNICFKRDLGKSGPKAY